jgi:HEAT repeat protein
MDNDQVRPYAARALGLIGDTRAIDPLSDALESDDSDAVRAAAAWALRQIGTEPALEAAADHVDDRAYVVQYEAQQAADRLDEGRERSDPPTA